MKKAVLVVSFGTSYIKAGEKNIDPIEQDIAGALPGWELRRAYTSSMIIKKLRERDGIQVDNMRQALKRLREEGYDHILVQPTHVIPGIEYEGMREDIRQEENGFACIACGLPLLACEEDFDQAANAMVQDVASYYEAGMEIVFMGHGSDHQANEAYRRLAGKLRERGERYHIGTVEAKPDLEDVKQSAKNSQSKKVLLQPLMIVAGDHAHNDMAGEEDSWKTCLEEAGFEVTCRLRGMGEIGAIRELFVSHVRKAAEGIGEKKQ